MDSIRKGEIDDCFLKKSRSCHLQDTGIYLYNNKCADYFFNCYSRNNEVYTRYQLWWIRGACVICGVLVLFYRKFSSLTLSSIAERFWVNPSYLSRYFKTYMGINIVQYIRSMRIFYAKSLLQSSDMSIAEVAEMVGIKSASHFSKIFENEVGESPSKFRKSYFDRNHS